MQVNVNNTFNSAEDKIQYALGLMHTYSIAVTCKKSGSSCVGILALTPMDAIIKVWSHYSVELQQDLLPQDTLKIHVNLCE